MSASEHTAETILETDNERYATVVQSVGKLVGAAASTGRDWKLVDALLRTVTRVILERGEAALVTVDEEGAKRRLHPDVAEHINAVIDSFSDDEAAALLGVGTRQLRRRAQGGGMYYFTVGKRRRYPAWQFDNRAGLLPGLQQIAATIPSGWRPETTRSVMESFDTKLAIHGEPVTPCEWLLLGLDPAVIVAEFEQREAARER
ncbi:hypothetical protein AB0300_16135 [Microbacterium sp. NPDC078814]|uniref:hypothetical protein n=1 Tax=Microbacterium sp. NPDC078814 TaxID=3154767 RepID=UPI003450F08E